MVFVPGFDTPKKPQRFNDIDAPESENLRAGPVMALSLSGLSVNSCEPSGEP